MKPVFQTKFNEDGNCWAACIASIFELDINKIPNFYKEYQSLWFYEFTKWLSEIGHYPFLIYHKNIHKTVYDFPPNTHYIASGQSPRGNFDHAVVAFGGELIHDPYPGGKCELLDIRDYCLFLSLI